MAVTLDHVIKAGQLRQPAGSSSRDCNLANLRIVANHGRTARRAANIKFETVAAMLQSKIEGGAGILRDSNGRTCAAMAEEEGITDHGAL